MRKFSFFLSLLTLIAGWAFFQSAGVVHACSGGAPLTLQQLLDRSDYVVQASVVETDEAGQNAILRVESYLAGGVGPEHMLFTRNHPFRTEYLLSGHSFGGDCLFLAQELAPADRFYAFVERQEDGSYSVIQNLHEFYLLRFPQADSLATVYWDRSSEPGVPTPEPGVPQRISEAQFRAIIQQASGESPTPPDSTSPYPLKAPLAVTTSDGTYMLPVDWGNPGPLPTAWDDHPLYNYGFSGALSCADEVGDVQVSPNDLIMAVASGDTVCFSGGERVDGQAVLFSTTSDAAAVWNGCQIDIYTLGYTRLLQVLFEYERVASVALEANDCSAFQAAAWSADGRLLAFTDDRGVMLWDVFTAGSLPELLIADATLMPQFFSPQGRYLNLANGAQRSYLDLVSGEMLPDGLFSADERVLARFATDNIPSDLGICALTPYTCEDALPMQMRLAQDADPVEFPQVTEIQWQNEASFLALACAAGQECALFQWMSVNFSTWDPEAIDEADAFDYEANTRTLAYVRDESTLVVRGGELTADGGFRGEFVDVEWLPSLFYYWD